MALQPGMDPAQIKDTVTSAYHFMSRLRSSHPLHQPPEDALSQVFSHWKMVEHDPQSLVLSKWRRSEQVS